MHYLKCMLVSIVFLPLFNSCNPCNNLDCLADNYYGQFRLVNATNGKDLVFGSTKIYDKNKIQFYSLTGTDTTFYDYQAMSYSDIKYDSILYVRFFPKSDTAFMKLSDGDVDTLYLTYNTFNTRCCGTITEITNFRFNNSAEALDNTAVLEIQK